MGIKEMKLKVFQTSLVGFNGQQTTILAWIQLLVTINVKTKLVNFMVIDTLSSYNIIRTGWEGYHHPTTKRWISPVEKELMKSCVNNECHKTATPLPLKELV